MPSTRTPEGGPNRCPICGHDVRIEPSLPTRDAPCPHCGHLLWFPAVVGAEEFAFFVGGGTIHELDATTKTAAVEELVTQLSRSGRLTTADVRPVVEAVLRREELGSTGIGNGVAVPHSKHPCVRELLGIIGHSSRGIEFDSLDGQPVHILFLLLTPPDKPGEHLRALEQISSHLRTGPGC